MKLLLLRLLNLPLIALLCFCLFQIIVEFKKSTPTNTVTVAVASEPAELPGTEPTEQPFASESAEPPTDDHPESEAASDEPTGGVDADLPANADSEVASEPPTLDEGGDVDSASELPAQTELVASVTAPQPRLSNEAVTGMVGSVDHAVDFLADRYFQLDDSIETLRQRWVALRASREAKREADRLAATQPSDPGIETAPSPGTVQIHNRTDRYPVAFLLDNQVRSIEPGQSIQVPGPATVHFDRGGNFGAAKQTLSLGDYDFRLTPEGWSLQEAAELELESSDNSAPDISAP